MRRIIISGIEDVPASLLLVLLIVILAVGFGSGYYFALQGAQAPTQTTTTAPAPPTEVQISGSVSTTTPFSSPSSIRFTSKTTGISHPGQVSGSRYTASMPNQDTYIVEIGWSSAISSGTCRAGVLVVFVGFASAKPLTSDWSC